MSLSAKGISFLVLQNMVTNRRVFASGLASAAPSPITLDLTNPAYSSLANIGAAITIPDPQNTARPMIVLRYSQTSIVALSSQCTYEGCQVSLPSGGIYTCPCCGSQYDSLGNVVKGPATKALTSYDAQLSGETITISFTSTEIRHFSAVPPVQHSVSVMIVEGHLHVSLPGDFDRYTVKLLNVRGIQIQSAVSAGGTDLSMYLGNLARGIYVTKVLAGDRVIFTQQIFIYG